jgi:hypothetical protein
MNLPFTRKTIPVLAVLASMIGCSSEPVKPEATAKPEASAAIIKDDRALATLKSMSETLAKTQSMTFRADSAVAIVSPSGQWVHVFGTSLVTLQRPNKLYVETRGDMFPQNFYYDGQTVTMYAPNEKLFATDNIPGNLDETLLQVFQKHGTYFSFADVIMSVPHDAMAKDVTSAELIGQSTIGGVLTNHLAFTSPGLEWEIWIGADDQLPRLLEVTYTNHKRRPTCSVAFSQWQLNPATSADTFVFTPPAGAVRIEFRKIEAPVPE